MAHLYTLGEIVAQLGGKLEGDAHLKIHRVASLARAQCGDIGFLSQTKHAKTLAQTQASAVVLTQENAHLTQGTSVLAKIIVDSPYAYFAKLSTLLNPAIVPLAGIHSSAVVDDTAHVPASCSVGALAVIGAHVILGENVVIGSACVVEAHSKIASNTVLEPHVVVKHHCEIGANCHLFSGAVIGSDGFGYAEENSRWLKIPQVGRVVIADDVDVGANTTIDRGALDDTVIEEGVKLDNLIQIGHNCVIGAHTVVAGCTGIAGSAHIGKHCKIGGAAMILGHLSIADGVTITPGSMITRSLTQADTYTALMPFQTHKEWLGTAAQLRHLNQMADKIKNLEKEAIKTASLLKSKLGA